MSACLRSSLVLILWLSVSLASRAQSPQNWLGLPEPIAADNAARWFCTAAGRSMTRCSRDLFS